MSFQYLKCAYNREGDCLFVWSGSDRTRVSSFKFKEERFILDIWMKFFTQNVVKHRNRLHREPLDDQSLRVFKVRLFGALSILT